jgi:hypothetical protein
MLPESKLPVMLSVLNDVAAVIAAERAKAEDATTE